MFIQGHVANVPYDGQQAYRNEAGVARISAKVGPNLKFGHIRPTLARLSSNIDPDSTEFCPMLAKFARDRPDRSGLGSRCARFGPEIGLIWPDVCQIWSGCVQTWAIPADV